jgi:hypothetical protein
MVSDGKVLIIKTKPMKRKNLMSMVLFAVMFSVAHVGLCVAGKKLSVSPQKDVTLKGDKNVITRRIDVGDFNKIEIRGNVDVQYSQAEAPDVMSVTLDKNLFDVYDFVVDVNTLVIAPKKEYKHTKIAPTRFVVKISSYALEKVVNEGTGIFEVLTPIESHKLRIENKGSGKVLSMKAITVKNLEVENTGSGDIIVVGKAEKGKLLIAGSGKINMENCAVFDCSCEVSGSGNIFVYAVDDLDCKMFGSGNVLYLGDPDITKDSPGTGRVMRR